MKKQFKKLFIYTSLLFVSVFTANSCSQKDELQQINNDLYNKQKQAKKVTYFDVDFLDSIKRELVNYQGDIGEYNEKKELDSNNNDKYSYIDISKNSGSYMYIHVYDDHNFEGKNSVFIIDRFIVSKKINLSEQIKYTKKCGFFGKRCKIYWNNSISSYKIYTSKTALDDKEWNGSHVIRITK